MTNPAPHLAAVKQSTTSVDQSAQPGLTRMSIETPLNGSTQPLTFLIAGYAFDPEAPSGSGVDGVVMYAYPNFGSGEPAISLGPAAYGLTRNDIARQYGSAFVSSGFQLMATGLPAGTYRIVAFAHNVATAAYSSYTFVDVSVQGFSAMSIDVPAASATVMPSFVIAGWAIDNQAADGTGIDAIHLYLSPNDGADPPLFLGVATYGVPRPDVAAAYGSRYANSGYQFAVNGLQPGNYLLTAFAHSSATGLFSLARAVRFRVDVTALVTIDMPSPGSAVDAPVFGVMGWAIDRSATGGSGIDTLHVYGFRNPGSGEPPIFLGVASVGSARPDVAAIYGSQFADSGYWLFVDRAALGLTPAPYDIVVWAHSSVTNSFTAVSVVRVTLR